MGAREDAARAEVISKVRALAKSKRTTPDGLFRLYDADGSGALSKSELSRLLKDADVGNALTRGLYVSGIFSALDVDSGGTLSRAELDGVLKSVPAPSGKRPTTAQLKDIGRKIARGELEDFDPAPYTSDEVAIIEAENLRVSQLPDASTLQPGDDLSLGVVKPLPKIPRASASDSTGWIVLVAIGALVLARG